MKYAYEVLKNKYEYDIDLIPIEIYANGQSKGQSGNWHQDSTNENLWTFLYYVNAEWTNPHWGGCTHFADSVEIFYLIHLNRIMEFYLTGQYGIMAKIRQYIQIN